MTKGESDAGASVIMEHSAHWFTLYEVSSRSAKLHSVLSKSVPVYMCNVYFSIYLM